MAEDTFKATITGLVLYLGFCSRDAFYKYIDKPEFRYTCRRLRTTIENFYESNLIGANTSGVVFALKNLGWKDKTEIDQNVNLVKMPAIEIDGKELEFDIGN